MAEQNHMIVAAIDFGTTYSGYAFQFQHEYKSDTPTAGIMAPQAWSDGKVKVASSKTPTCLLLDDNKKVISFGYEAERKFIEKCEEGEQNDCYFFRRFKMNLQKVKDIASGLKIRGENKRELPASEVFSKSIQCLKDKLMEELGKVSKSEDIFFVLTVPAIWSDQAKEFMRNAAERVDIKNGRLEISLEPECASLWCQYLPLARFGGTVDKKCHLTAPGTVYMIVDLGGGTADITVHEKQEGGTLREIHQATGGPWGGAMVDAHFIQLMTGIVTPLAFSEFMFKHAGDYTDMMREFEIMKRKVSTVNTDELVIKMPASLNEVAKNVLHKKFAEAVEESPYADEITVKRDKIKISADRARDLFERVADKIIPTLDQCIDDVQKLDEPKRISLILMVGGFSESPYMQETIKNRYDGKKGMRVLIPEEAGLSVLKGAVIFGRQPNCITARVLRVTYGAEVTPPFDSDIHDENMRTKDGKRCMHVFKPFMVKGQRVDRGYELKNTYHTTAKNQKSITLKIFTTEADDVKYTTDDRCNFLGTLTMTLNTPTVELQDLSITYIFGETEIKVLGREERTGHECETVIKMDY